MKPEPEKRLDALLRDWQPPVNLPPRLESEVWRRIALAQEKHSDFWSFSWLFRMACPPKLAFALVVTTVVLGTGLANWQAERNYHQDMAASKSRYIHSVDPFAQTF
ncbi:MAG TPA: hypothetical protein VGC39_11855 [Candidatus Methylacidiphilales bacterium]